MQHTHCIQDPVAGVESESAMKSDLSNHVKREASFLVWVCVTRVNSVYTAGKQE